MYSQTNYDIEIQSHAQAISRMIVEASAESLEIFDFVVKRAISNFQDFLTCGISSSEEDTVKLVLCESYATSPSVFRFDCNSETQETYEILKPFIENIAFFFYEDDEDENRAETRTESILMRVQQAIA